MKIHWHEHNPWKDELLYITLEEFIPLVSTNDSVARYVKEYGDKVDAYILPSGSVGLRYGAEGHEYLSPLAYPIAVIGLLFDKTKNPVLTYAEGAFLCTAEHAVSESYLLSMAEAAIIDDEDDKDEIGRILADYCDGEYTIEEAIAAFPKD